MKGASPSLSPSKTRWSARAKNGAVRAAAVGAAAAPDLGVVERTPLSPPAGDAPTAPRGSKASFPAL